MSDPDAQLLVCTHATLRFAYQKMNPADFNDVLLAIDEFHHTSADGENRLGELIDGVMLGSNAHIVAMTGSYFRGDAVPILLPEDEEKFVQVTYSYYEQLNGYLQQHIPQGQKGWPDLFRDDAQRQSRFKGRPEPDQDWLYRANRGGADKERRARHCVPGIPSEYPSLHRVLQP